jgi:hypothetical protein
MSKRTTGEVVVTGGGAIVVVLGLTLYMWLNDSPSRLRLEWDYPPEELDGVIFEVVSKTNIASPWRFCAHVVGTNTMPFLADKEQEFFTISRVMRRDDTNIQTVQIGF